MEEAADGMAETGDEPVQDELRVVGCCARMALDRAEVDTSIFVISEGIWAGCAPIFFVTARWR